MRKSIKTTVLALLVSAFMLNAAGSQTFKVAIIQLATSDYFMSLAKTLAEETGASFEIQLVPAPRAAYLIENKQVDVVFPKSLIKDPAKMKDLKFDYSSSTLYTTAFVLYSNKAKALDVENLKAGNSKGYKIETNAANLGSFTFLPLASTNVEGSLKKVDSAAIDGYIYAQVTTDSALRSLGLKNISRQAYMDQELGFAIQKGARGGSLDNLIVEGMKKLKANGKFEKIMGALVREGKYDNWQP